jgi:nitroreductase
MIPVMDTPPPGASSRLPESLPVSSADETDPVIATIHRRRNTTPRRLVEPGATLQQLEQLLLAAAAAPDHGQLTPWRFVLVAAEQRDALADLFEQALHERDPGAAAEDRAMARDKAARAPTLMLAVVDLTPSEKAIAIDERLVSLGCAIQNMLLAAESMGLGSGLSSGQAIGSATLRRLFRLHVDERAVCFVAFGTVSAKPSRAAARRRPAPGRFFSIWTP